MTTFRHIGPVIFSAGDAPGPRVYRDGAAYLWVDTARSGKHVRVGVADTAREAQLRARATPIIREGSHGSAAVAAVRWAIERGWATSPALVRVG